VSVDRRLAGRALALALGVVLLSTGCALGSGTLGGREKCWPETEARAASIWRGTLRIDASGSYLDTPEGEVIPLLPGAMAMRVGGDGVGELVRGNDVVARAGDDLTLFGGAGADGALVVCGVEEIHSASRL
jgi:hypothetical protein